MTRMPPTDTDTGAAARQTAGTAQRPRARDRRGARVLLWIVAVVVMMGAAIYQRRTGPTYPLHGTLTVGDFSGDYRLIRSEESTRDARVEIPDPGHGASATLYYRRFPLDEPFAALPMTAADGVLAGELPAQPAAGKLEYYVEVHTPDSQLRIPARADDDVIIRFKDPVPLGILIPHVLFMFFAILFGVGTGLSALFDVGNTRRYAWTALGLMTIGGMILGPIVQKFAFGALWTGVPFGYDLTDNKTLIMWLAWIVAAAALGRRRRAPGRERWARLVVVGATVVMMAVYLIPHSFRGSQLDYTQLEQGVDPANAIQVGR